MKNIKVHAIVLALIIIAEMIGNVSFKIGVGTIVLLPMLYALIMGIFMAPKFLKVVNQKDMLDASSLIGITLMLLMHVTVLWLGRRCLKFWRLLRL